MFTIARIDSDTWDLVDTFDLYPSISACEDFIETIKQPETSFNIIDERNEIVKRLVF